MRKMSYFCLECVDLSQTSKQPETSMGCLHLCLSASSPAAQIAVLIEPLGAAELLLDHRSLIYQAVTHTADMPFLRYNERSNRN